MLLLAAWELLPRVVTASLWRLLRQAAAGVLRERPVLRQGPLLGGLHLLEGGQRMGSLAKQRHSLRCRLDDGGDALHVDLQGVPRHLGLREQRRAP